MAGGMTQTTFVIVAAAFAMILMNGVAGATTHIVGDAAGWSVPPSATFYQTWADKQTFVIGDILDFEFSTGSHTVAYTTSKAAYDKCDASLDKNAKTIKIGPFNLGLPAVAGQYYYFCTITTHCLNGQKFVATVSAKSPAGVTPVSPPPPPPYSPTTPPPPPTKSAAALTSFTFSASSFMLSLVLAFLY